MQNNLIRTLPSGINSKNNSLAIKIKALNIYGAFSEVVHSIVVKPYIASQNSDIFKKIEENIDSIQENLLENFEVK